MNPLFVMKLASLKLGCVLSVLAVLLLTSGSAQAFEREWHLGAGVGISDLTASGIGWGPELGVHGAYGISDSVDVRLEGRFSRHPLRLESQGIDEQRNFFRVEAALAYKLDILRWVPWAALGVGYLHALEKPLPQQDLARANPLLSGTLGLDYAVSRNFGLGIVARGAVLLEGTVDYGGQLRAEYRWGF